MFLVRKERLTKSETIARASSAGRAVQNAVDFLMEAGRDYEHFYCIEVDDHGRFVREVESVSWEPECPDDAPALDQLLGSVAALDLIQSAEARKDEIEYGDHNFPD